MAGFRKIGTRKARALKPGWLPAVEPELRVAPPRPDEWLRGEWAGKRTERSEKLLVHGQASRAWVTAHAVEREGSSTDHFVQFAFPAGGKIVSGKFMTTYDDRHLDYSSPDFANWLKVAFCEGGTFTVLFDRDKPSDHVIYGSLEPYLKRSLLDASRDLSRNKDPAEIDRLARRFLDIALAPLGVVGDEFEEYYALLEQIGLVVGVTGATYGKNLRVVKTAFDGGWIDKQQLSRLSRICKKYHQGIWAAT